MQLATDEGGPCLSRSTGGPLHADGGEARLRQDVFDSAAGRGRRPIALPRETIVDCDRLVRGAVISGTSSTRTTPVERLRSCVCAADGERQRKLVDRQPTATVAEQRRSGTLSHLRAGAGQYRASRWWRQRSSASPPRRPLQTSTPQPARCRAARAGRASGVMTQPVAPPIVQRSGAVHPGSRTRRGKDLHLKAGEERDGVNIRNVLVRAARVEGMSVVQRQPLQNVLVGIANASAGRLWGSPGLVRPGRMAISSCRHLRQAATSSLERLDDAGPNAMTRCGRRRRSPSTSRTTNDTIPAGRVCGGRIVFRDPRAASDDGGAAIVSGGADDRRVRGQSTAGQRAVRRTFVPGITPRQIECRSRARKVGLALAIAGGQDVLDVPLGGRGPRRHRSRRSRMYRLKLPVNCSSTESPGAGILGRVVHGRSRAVADVGAPHDRPIRLASDGTFRFVGVAPGDYCRARSPRSSAPARRSVAARAACGWPCG